MSERGVRVRRRSVLATLATAPMLAGCIGSEPANDVNETASSENGSLVINENERRNATGEIESGGSSTSTGPASSSGEISTSNRTLEKPDPTPNPTPASNETEAPTPTNETESEPITTDDPEQSTTPSGGGASPGGGSGGGGGTDPEPKPEPEPEESTEISIESSYSTDGIGEFSAIEWFDGGALVIKQGSGFRLTESTET